MNEGRMNNGTNSRLKRTVHDEDTAYKDEPPSKSQRLYLPSNDDQPLQGSSNVQYDNSDINEYNYKKIAATTLYKKLQVLEARDRLLRSSTSQTTSDSNVDEVTPLKGSCPDMCPERERLLRIHGNMVSHFECKQIDSKLEPIFEIMVKQYARSSADQANPLPHELRPTSVLVRTMHYMLKNIIYPIESNIEQDLASWYDFCWDRLRAIRKDIVQQNLQNAEVITILEQIGRFHVVCYDLMTGYPGFDIKLNTENLNNCIQMLMPMYKDSDQQCANEPEFVSYELLMHLGNPQFHTAYDALPLHIKQTPEVRFCIKAHVVYLQSSDCIDFFNLLKNTTYMNCCILQKVIPNIRYNCIKMMNMSFTTVKRVYMLEMKHLIKTLCFDDVQEAQEFCSEIQLKYDNENVELSRKIAVSPPEYSRQRQESVVVKKRQNLTFLISGLKNLSNVVINSVHSSFDCNDYYINDLDDLDLVNKNMNRNIQNQVSESQMDTDSYSSNSNNSFSFNKQSQPSNIPISTPSYETPTFTFKLPKQPSISPQKPATNLETQRKMPITSHDVSPAEQLHISTNCFSLAPNIIKSSPITFNNDLFVKPTFTVSAHLSPVQSLNKISFLENQQFKQLTCNEMNIAKKYISKWHDFISCKKTKCIEKMFSPGELFYSECISSLSSSPSSETSLKIFNYDNFQDKPKKEWLHKQFQLAEKYFYIWLRKVLRKRRMIEIDPVNSMPWSIFMQVHGTPKETLLSIGSKSKKNESKTPIKTLKNHQINKNNNDNFSENIANMFVENIIAAKKHESIGNKIFWKLAVNYGNSPEPYCIQNKVQTIIYGKIGFNNNQVQTILTDSNKYLIKSVESIVGLHDWTKSGLNAALVFTNTTKEDMETLFKRVELILNSTPTAIPLVLIFSSNSNKNEIDNYKSVLDAYQENDYLNNYSVRTWEGPKTILEALEFFSTHYIDIAPDMHSEKLFYNLLNFSQSFYLKMRLLLPTDNPNIIIEKYNLYLDAYINRLGKNNLSLRDLAPELVPYYTQNPEDFSNKYSNLNLKYFESTLINARLLPYELWPPQSFEDLIDYVKNMCRLTNRRCWCLDILQMLQLDRNESLEDCLLNANWYEVIEMWIQGALEKCSAANENFTVLYSGNPISDVLKIVFQDC